MLGVISCILVDRSLVAVQEARIQGTIEENWIHDWNRRSTKSHERTRNVLSVISCILVDRSLVAVPEARWNQEVFGYN